MAGRSAGEVTMAARIRLVRVKLFMERILRAASAVRVRTRGYFPQLVIPPPRKPETLADRGASLAGSHSWRDSSSRPIRSASPDGFQLAALNDEQSQRRQVKFACSTPAGPAAEIWSMS